MAETKADKDNGEKKSTKKAAKVEKPNPLSDVNSPTGVYVGGWAKLTAGDKEGTIVSVESDVPDSQDVNVRTRDDDSELLTVKFADLELAESGGR